MNHSDPRHPFDLATPSDVPTPEARLRREAMLAELAASLHRRNRNRRALRVVAAVLVLAVIPTTIAARLAFQTPVAPLAVIRSAHNTPAPLVKAARIQVIGNTPDVLTRFAPPPATYHIEQIDDAQLQALLARSGRPEGLVRVDGCTLLADDFARPAKETPKLNAAPQTGPQTLQHG